MAARKLAVPAARLISQSSHIVPGKLKITEYFFDVPTDYSSSSSRPLRLFARAATKHTVEVGFKPTADAQPPAYLLYLQGGPGFQCPTPQSYGFTSLLVDKGYTVLFMDQRGTGLSTPVTASTVAQRAGPDHGAQAAYLKHFRADSIVRDAEAIRQCLTADAADAKSKKWSIIGQSFGGFCATTYLSFYPEGLREVFIAGGLPPVARNNPDDVYRRLLKRVSQRNREYYEKYPQDVERVRRIATTLLPPASTTVLPSGGALTARRFLAMGLGGLGFSGGFDDLHATVLRCASDIEQFGGLTRGTLAAVEDRAGGPFDTNPIYCVLHEPLYNQGEKSAWSAWRVLQQEFPEFRVPESAAEAEAAAADERSRQAGYYFTGEQVFPWMLECHAELKELAGPAELLAQADDWPRLYDEQQLRQNRVPTYAMVYADDLYVDLELAMETAGTIAGCRAQVVSRMFHNSIRAKPAEVIKYLFDMRDDTID